MAPAEQRPFASLELQAITSFRAAWLAVPRTTAGLSIGGRGGRCVFAVAAIRDCISILAVGVAASHVSDIFAVAAGLRLMIRPGLIAMVFSMVATAPAGFAAAPFSGEVVAAGACDCAAACDAGLC